VSLENGIARAGVARLYARRKIESFRLNLSRLQEDLGYEEGRKQFREKIIETGLRYHLVTRYTSLVAVEKESSRPHDAPLEAWPVPTHLPAGWQLEKIWLEKPAMKSEAATAGFISAEKTSIQLEKKRAANGKRLAERRGKLEERKPNALQRQIASAQPLVAAHLPRTATPALLFMLTGLLLLITAVFLRRRVRAQW